MNEGEVVGREPGNAINAQGPLEANAKALISSPLSEIRDVSRSQLTQMETYWGGTLPSLILNGDYNVSDQEQANRTGRRVLHKPVWAHTLLAALRFEIGRSAQM